MLFMRGGTFNDDIAGKWYVLRRALKFLKILE